MRLRRTAPAQAKSSAALPDPDQAWKALALVNDWVKHAEAKLGVALAATGVSGGVLFNLVNDPSHASVAFDVAATVCGAAVIVAGACAVVGLYPVVRLRHTTTNDSANPLFFHDIARVYESDPPSYGAVLHTLTTNPDDLVRHLSQQVHANATVAQRKYRWANRAIRALLLGFAALGALATIVALKW